MFSRAPPHGSRMSQPMDAAPWMLLPALGAHTVTNDGALATVAGSYGRWGLQPQSIFATVR